jgi:serine/threonine-protein kinase
MTDAAPQPGGGPAPRPAHLFGEVAISLGLITAEQRDEALRRQVDYRPGLSKSRLGEVLILMKVLSVEQVRKVLSEQRKRRQADADQKLPVERFAEYVLLERLGEGGMGVVFKARDVIQDRIVALKVLRKGLGVDKEYLQRFERELGVAARLEHPNLVATYACGVFRGIQYLAMEYIEGETLKARLDREFRLPEADAIRVGLAVAQALGHAHEKGYVHRDVKPANILLARDGAVRLADLGLAKSVYGDSHLTRTGQVIGTPYYISPEQARGDKEPDPRSDLYALGATLYHALTGRVPFMAASAMDILLLHIQGTLTNPKDINPELSDGMVQVLVKLLAKHPEDRYAKAELLCGDLECLRQGKPPACAALDLGRSTILPPTRKKAAKRGCLPLLLLGVGLVGARWLR